MMKRKRKSQCTTTTADGSCSNRVLLLVFTANSNNLTTKGIDKMTWYKIKDWKYKNYNGKLGISVVESEKIDGNDIPDIVHETLSTSVIDDTIDEFYGDVEICGNKYSASIALKSTDAIAYDEMREEICEMKAEEIIDEMPGKPTTFHAMINQCRIYWE